MTRMFTAAAIAALMAGSAMAQSSQPQGAEPELNPQQNANESTARPETGDAMLGADGRQVQPGAAPMDQGAMTDSMNSGMAEPMPMDSATTTAMAQPAPMGATVTTSTVTNGPVPDTPENRAKYGKPMSNAGKRTTPAGN